MKNVKASIPTQKYFFEGKEKFLKFLMLFLVFVLKAFNLV